jgi:molybdate transport system ATP-binding protein
MIDIRLKKKLSAASGEMLLDVQLEIKAGEFITLYGDSGAGKTSVLRMLAGLMQPDEGKIIVDQNTWFDSENGTELRTQRRPIGFLFQEYALFPNMTVRENLLFALDKGQDKAIVDDLIEIIELEDLQHRNPDKLSGGQKQRVALARALVRKPRILMLDEPFSALDRNMRIKLQDYVLKVHRQFKLTTLLISHEISEVIKMSDRIFIIENGKIVKNDRPLSLFTNQQVSGKFQFTGEIISIEKADVIYIVHILVGANFVKIIADQTDVAELQAGDQVLVASKAFNPMIIKLNKV